MARVEESDSSLALQLRNYRLTTAHILYRLPDHPSLLQEYIWQDLDLAPRFPVLNKFLRFWEDNLDGKLHSVKVAHTGIIKPAEVRTVSGGLYIN
ncbi:MAG: Usg family protein [Rhodospirillaceae bacterium]|nr:MAG: Usg family protein [Rhodospirillaceae bacterium]